MKKVKVILGLFLIIILLALVTAVFSKNEDTRLQPQQLAGPWVVRTFPAGSFITFHEDGSFSWYGEAINGQRQFKGRYTFAAGELHLRPDNGREMNVHDPLFGDYEVDFISTGKLLLKPYDTAFNSIYPGLELIRDNDDRVPDLSTAMTSQIEEYKAPA